MLQGTVFRRTEKCPGERVWCKRRWGGVAYSTVFFTQLVVAGLRPIVLKGTEGGEMKGSFLPQAVGTQNGCENLLTFANGEQANEGVRTG